MNKKIILSILIIVGIFKIDALTAAITIEEITVTARYRSENLQQVPLSISAFSCLVFSAIFLISSASSVFSVNRCLSCSFSGLF